MSAPRLSIVIPTLGRPTLIETLESLLASRGIEEAEIRTYMEENAKTFYAYAMASPVIYKKPTVELREWTANQPDNAGKGE